MARNEQSDGKMSREEAGRLGGEKVAQERGSEFYSEIGQRGGENSPGQFGKEQGADPSEAGRKGGQARGNQNQDDDR